MSTITENSTLLAPPVFKSHYDNFIGGRWVTPVRGEYFESISPVDGQVFTKVARSTEEDIELALDAAWAAAPKWNHTSATERSNMLLKIADRMEQNLALLAKVETWDNGKPIRETTAADLPLAIDHFRYFAGVIRAEEGSAADYNFHFTNDIAINQIIQRLIFLFTENHPSKDLFSDMMIQELLIRILQMEQKNSYVAKSITQANSNRFSYVLNYIREHLTEDITVGLLSEKANMSESSFYRSFRLELGITPNDYIIEERLKIAESALKDPNMSIKEAYLLSGFNSFSYFCRIFKKKHRLQPSAYKAQCLMQ